MQSDFDYLYTAGTHRGIEFQIGARADPSTNDIHSFAVILFFAQADGTRVEVAKVDNSEHEEGTIHVDRYYREVGTDDKDFDVDIGGMWDADEYLEQNWRRFAKTFLENHGEGPRRE